MLLKELCLEITNKCPLRCIHCSSNSSFYPKDKLNFELIKRIIDDFKKLGGKILEISGGEPLLYKNLCHVIRYAKQKGLAVYLYTTGFKLDSRGIKALLNAGTNRFLFSVQGSKANTHDKVTGKKDSFSNTLKAVIEIKRMGAYAGIHFVPMKVNYQELKDLFDIAANLGIDELAILRFVPQGRGGRNKDSLELSKKEAKYLLDVIQALNRKYRFIRLGCPIDFSLGCKAGKKTLTIRSDGKVNLCPAFKYQKIVGDIKKENLRTIWTHSAVLYSTRKSQKNNRGCLAQNFYHGGKDPWYGLTA